MCGTRLLALILQYCRFLFLSVQQLLEIQLQLQSRKLVRCHGLKYFLVTQNFFVTDMGVHELANLAQSGVKKGVDSLIDHTAQGGNG